MKNSFELISTDPVKFNTWSIKSKLIIIIRKLMIDNLSLIHISEPTRLGMISYAVFCLKKFFLMIRRPPRSTLSPSSAASDVYKRQGWKMAKKRPLDWFFWKQWLQNV